MPTHRGVKGPWVTHDGREDGADPHRRAHVNAGVDPLGRRLAVVRAGAAPRQLSTRGRGRARKWSTTPSTNRWSRGATEVSPAISTGPVRSAIIVSTSSEGSR